MTISRRELWQSAKVLILALFLSVGVPYALAWTGPTAAPPGNNTPTPINVSATTQTKSGALIVSTDFISNTISTNAFKMTTGAGSGKVFTSDASGNASWQTMSYNSLPSGSIAGYYTSSGYTTFQGPVLPATSSGCSSGWTRIMMGRLPSDADAGSAQTPVYSCIKN